MRKLCCLLAIAGAVLLAEQNALAAETTAPEPRPELVKPSKPRRAIKPMPEVSPGGDARWKDVSTAAGVDRNLMLELNYNQATVWSEPNQQVALELLERGTNPGLGVRGLHAQGITGRGVSVGIIDQNICLDHPEFSGQIAKYQDVGCDAHGSSSMHGPAVASLLVGKNIGTAPDARLYFAAAPSWTKDTKFQAAALNWLLDENEKLPASEKIRVISVSAAPSGAGSPFDRNTEMWDAACNRAEQAGVLVLDATSHRGIIGPCYYDIDAPDDFSRVTPGYPSGTRPKQRNNMVLVPNSRRTNAEQYQLGQCGYQFSGRGGLSWSIPYAAGVLAMGWQLRPELSPEQMLQALRDTAYKNGEHRIINPPAFIERVRTL